MTALHDSLRLYISNEAYSLVAEGEKGETLRIDRSNSSISLFPSSIAPPKFDKELPVFGLFGIVSLLRSDYLIVITKRIRVTSLLGTPIFSPTDFAVFPVVLSTNDSLLAHPDENYLLGLLKTHLFSAPFYFTYGGYNVTQRVQMQASAGAKEGAWWETCDDRFFWNKYLHSRLINAGPSADCSRFILPVMFGFLNIQSTTIASRPLTFGLISRRSRHRAGTRYFSRGIDREGNVSNFNETEQILILNNPGGAGEKRFAFVQTRGSVPVFWAEINNLRYKPDLKIMDLSTTAESLALHFEQQVALYGDQYLVNLVNQKGYEKPVKEAYERALDVLGNKRVHYTYFDFHAECKGLRFDRVQGLIDGLDDELHRQGYFYQDTATSPSRPQLMQTSVVRSNCMDCLDRTNVVQSAMGKWVLNNQLRQAGVFSTKEGIDEHAAFLKTFRNVWADNADVVSKAYSGTGALKTDYTRTGKRSAEGALQDGVNSVMRYVKNNFLDGPRQDSYDLVTGAWVPRKGETSWGDERDIITRAAPYLLAFALALLSLTIFAPLIAAYIASTQQLVLVAFVLLAAAGIHIINNGIDYVSWPRLVVLDETLNYSGKGYESGRRGRPIRSVNTDALRATTSVAARKETSVLPQTAAKRD